MTETDYAVRVSDRDGIVMQVSRRGIWVPPDIPTDECARRVLDALSPMIRDIIEAEMERLTSERDEARAEVECLTAERNAARIKAEGRLGAIQLLAAEIEFLARPYDEQTKRQQWGTR